MDICAVGYPYLEELHARYNESVGLYIPAGNVRICVARIDCTQALRQTVPIGSTRPIDCGAAGHVLVAFGDSSQTQEIQRISSTCTKSKLDQVRSRGYSVSYGEIISGLTSIAAPVFDSKNKLVCAMVLAAPSIRVPTQVEEAYIRIVKATAAKMSAKLGYCGSFPGK